MFPLLSIHNYAIMKLNRSAIYTANRDLCNMTKISNTAHKGYESTVSISNLYIRTGKQQTRQRQLLHGNFCKIREKAFRVNRKSTLKQKRMSEWITDTQI